MSIAYRRLDERDLDSFMGLRIRQLREEGATEDIDLRPALLDYYTRHMKDGSSVAWLAVDDGGGKNRRDKRHVIRRETAVFRMSKWQDGLVVQHVHGFQVPASRHREGAVAQSR